MTALQFEFRAPDQERALAAAESFDDMEAALQGVIALQFSILSQQMTGRQMFSVELDRLIPTVARKFHLADVALEPGNANALIVATRFLLIGGHTKVADDISAIIGRDRTSAILTDAFGKLRHRNLLGLLRGEEHSRQRSIALLGARTAIEKIVELYMLIAMLRPSRIFLMGHHFDIVAPIALWPFRGVVEYVHHADHLPTLGATLPFARHIDLTYTCHGACRAAGMAADYVGMTTPPVPSVARRQPFSTPDRIRFATCGSENKYAGQGRYRWSDFAVAALALPGAELLHIGPIDDEIRADVAQGLAQAGIDPARYRFVGKVDNLARALIEQEIDVYLGSYPAGGGKASLEAMAAGLRPILPIDDSTPPLLRIDYPIPTFRTISRPGEIATAVAEMRARTPADIAADLDLVRRETARFERYVAGE